VTQGHATPTEAPTEAPRVAMLGGTFDPVHLGHLRSAVELRELLNLDRVHMVPAKLPPLRNSPQVSARQRLALLQLGIGDTPGLLADGRELEREGPSYSSDTLASLRDEYGSDARLIMALGHDAFLRLPEWHAPQRLFELAHLVIIERPDHQASLSTALRELIAGREVDSPESLMQRPAGSLLRVTLATRMAVSATGIRQRLAAGQSVRYLLPEAVETRIMQASLYQRH